MEKAIIEEKFIRETIGVTYIRIRQVAPARNRCIRLFRKTRNSFVSGHSRPFVYETLEELYAFFLNKSYFPCLDSIAHCMRQLTVEGWTWQGESLPQQKNSVLEKEFHCFDRGKLIYRIQLQLLIQDNEATLTSFLLTNSEVLRTEFSFYQIALGKYFRLLVACPKPPVQSFFQNLQKNYFPPEFYF